MTWIIGFVMGNLFRRVLLLLSLIVLYIWYDGTNRDDTPLTLHVWTARQIPPNRIEALYTSPKVINLRIDLIKRYRQSTAETRRVIVSNKPGHGFGSVFNLLLSTFQFAQNPEINRLVQVDTDSFEYGTLQEFFYPFDSMSVDDGTFSREFSFGDYDGEHPVSVLTPSASYIDKQVDYTNLRIHYETKEDINGKRELVIREMKNEPSVTLGIRHETGHYEVILNEYNDNLERAYTADEIILQRRVLAQVLWEPLPFIRLAIDHLVSIMTSSGSWTAVQVRRGDKLIGESKDHKPLAYVDKLTHIVVRDPKVSSVLLISDDRTYLRELAVQIRSSKQLKKMRIFYITDLLDDVFAESKGAAMFLEGGWNAGYLYAAPRHLIKEHTRDLIVSLSVMAQAPYVVCTYSSNICRLVQLLRTQSLDSVLSVDEDWHPR